MLSVGAACYCCVVLAAQFHFSKETFSSSFRELIRVLAINEFGDLTTNYMPPFLGSKAGFYGNNFLRKSFQG